MVKGVLKSSKTKDVYHKFVSILDARPCIRDLAPTLKLRGNPPVPPGQVDPPCTPVQGNPTPNSGSPSGSSWELGKIPTDEEEPKKLFSYRNPLYIKPSVPPPKVSHLIPPIPPIPHQGSKAGEREPMVSNPSGSGGIPAVHAGNTPVDHSQGDPSLDKMPKQEASSQEVAKPTKGILRPSKLPRRDLKYSDDWRTILDPSGCPIWSIQLTDIAKSGKSSASGSGAAKRKEPDTPDFGSGGASAPVQK